LRDGQIEEVRRELSLGSRILGRRLIPPQLQRLLADRKARREVGTLIHSEAYP
jgi:hypothetical protein